jgi:hypothetical protein
MSAQMELVGLACDDSQSDTIRFSLSDGNTVSVAINALARSPHLNNIVPANSEEGTLSVWMPQGCISVWLKHVAQSDNQSEAALSRSSPEDLVSLLKV